MPKNSKRGHLGSINVFTNRKLRKNAMGYPLIEFENFQKKRRIVPKKPNGTLWSRLYFWKHKKLWFSARIEPTIFCFSEN